MSKEIENIGIIFCGSGAIDILKNLGYKVVEMKPFIHEQMKHHFGDTYMYVMLDEEKDIEFTCITIPIVESVVHFPKLNGINNGKDKPQESFYAMCGFNAHPALINITMRVEIYFSRHCKYPL